MRINKNSITGFITGLLVAVFYSSGAGAAPSGADLEIACRQSLDKGFQGDMGMVCSWYVTPCDCDYGKKGEIPRVCLPEAVTIEKLAGQVLTGLQNHPELKTRDAGFAASSILFGQYVF